MMFIQDHYPEDVAHCYGCGRLNEAGHQLKTTWDGTEAITHFTPSPHHISIPGFVYGGLLASLVDCHAMATAAAAVVLEAGGTLGEAEVPRYVTGSLHVDYLRPTPLGTVLELRGRVREKAARKVIVDVTVAAKGEITVRGQVVAVRLPDTMR